MKETKLLKFLNSKWRLQYGGPSQFKNYFLLTSEYAGNSKFGMDMRIECSLRKKLWTSTNFKMASPIWRPKVELPVFCLGTSRNAGNLKFGMGIRIECNLLKKLWTLTKFKMATQSWFAIFLFGHFHTCGKLEILYEDVE